MNKLNKSIAFAVLLFGAMALITACGGGSDHADHNHGDENHEHVDGNNHDTNLDAVDSDVETSAYMCPMKCEGEKTYTEAGTCPECKMDLELLADAGDVQEEIPHDHDGDGHPDHE